MEAAHLIPVVRYSGANLDIILINNNNNSGSSSPDSSCSLLLRSDPKDIIITVETAHPVQAVHYSEANLFKLHYPEADPKT